MNSDIIMECISTITNELPLLRDRLKITQKELATSIGISRQSLIEIEHKNRKITKSILISLITYFSFREVTARILWEKEFYNNDFVKELGFKSGFLKNMYGIKDGGIK